MSKLKWTAAGLKLLGELLEQADIEDWLMEKVKCVVKDQSIRVAVPWFFGNRRTTKAVFASVAQQVNGSEALKYALEASLRQLPSVVSNTASVINKDGPSELHESNFTKWLAIVPRAVVRGIYRSSVIGDLVKSAELSRFDAWPRQFLRSQADSSEEAFFQFVKQHGEYVCPNVKSLVLGTDSSFDWHLGHEMGHYYLVHTDSGPADLTTRGDRKNLRAWAEPILVRMKVCLGGLSNEVIEAIAAYCRPAINEK